MLQDCNKQDFPPVGPTYCSYIKSWVPETPIVERGCADLHETPELLEPPLGSAVCVDQEIVGKKVILTFHDPVS